MKVPLINLLLAVQRETGIPLELILSKTKERDIADARRIAIKLLFDKEWKADVIAAIFDIKREHVYAAIKRQTELNRIYKNNKEKHDNCERRLTA